LLAKRDILLDVRAAGGKQIILRVVIPIITRTLIIRVTLRSPASIITSDKAREAIALGRECIHESDRNDIDR